MKMIRRPHISKKVVIIVAAVFAVLVIFGGAGWWWLSQKATADYRSQFASYKQAATHALANAGKAFQGVTDYNKRIAALKTLTDSATAWKNTQPALPALLGIPLVTKQDVDTQNAILKQLDQLKTAATNTKAFLEYQHAVTAMLAEVNGKTGNNADEQKALAAAWLGMLNKLKAMSPPVAAKTTHSDLLGRISNVQAALAALPDLFTNKDTNGFAARQAELNKHLDTVRSMSDMYKTLGTAQDKTLAATYASVLGALK